MNENDFLISEWYIYGKLVLSELYTNDKNCNSKKLLENEMNQSSIILPDYSFFIDTKPEEALKRIKTRNIVLESKESYEMLKNAYLIWQKYIEKYNIETINGLSSVVNNVNKILTKVLKNNNY